MRIPGRTIAFVLLAAAATSCVSDAEIEDGENDAFPSGKADGGIDEGSPEALGVLALVNDPAETAATLKAGAHITIRAAGNIVHHRDGADATAGTEDDDRFDTLAELDAIPYVGPATLNALIELARQRGLVHEGPSLRVIFSPQPAATSSNAAIAQAIRGAQHTVDVAIYSYSDAGIAAALADAVHRGVQVRFLFDTANADRKLDAVVAVLDNQPSPAKDATVEEPRELRLAIVGRPNVGKSSLLNQFLGEERVIVSPVAGTTRDAIDTVLETPERRFRIIDTAGIRRKGKTELMAEKLSVIMARKSLERADVAVVVIDAEEGVTALDATIAGYAVEAGCSIILAVNKWDRVVNKETNTAAEFERSLRDKMKFLEWAPVVTISALTGQRVDRILSMVLMADDARNRRIPTSQLNQFFEDAIAQPRGSVAPAPAKGGVSRLRVQYLTQVGVRPPTFVVFTAGGKPGLHFSYARYLQNRLRDEFDFFATPLRIVERHKKAKK